MQVGSGYPKYFVHIFGLESVYKGKNYHFFLEFFMQFQTVSLSQKYYSFVLDFLFLK